MSSHLHTTSRVWLKVGNLKYVSGIVETVNDRELIINTEDGQRVNVPRGSDRVSQRTRADMETVDNLTTLPDLDEPNMLHSLNARYLEHKIYTRTGPILVAMNPWQELKLYGSEVLHSYRRKQMDHVPPHVFAIAEAAFANLQSARKDQTILVSGDSGSGKTESTKFMMQYLAAVAHHTAVTANTEQQVLQCNPVLEAFGNAKTLRNDNSSRFGKYIDIHFDERFALCGAKIDTYLLEKSRVVGQETGERNFHIFYQMCSQSENDPAISSELGLKASDQFSYTKKGHSVAVNYKPANSFSNTKAAMQGIGIEAEECNQIFQVLGAILHLGDIALGEKDGDAVIHSSDQSSVWASKLLGVGQEALIQSFTNRNIQAGPQGLGDSYIVAQTGSQALEARNALARALYGNMFDILVQRINVSLGQKRAEKTRTISILDIFGFEHFKTNHFEQFCINYANEKLQGHFNEYNFSLEIKEYQREDIQWTYDDFYFQTNTKCIELVEGKRTGMLALLDEQCIMPNGNDESFCTKLKSDIKDNPHLYSAKMRGNNFTLKHYAAEVVYDATGFCFKNKDPVQPSMVELMSTSTSEYVQKIFSAYVAKLDANAQSKTGKKAQSTIIFESVTAQFKRQLGDLMARINAAQPHFVRCINPNSQKSATKLEPEMILDQLRCSGLMEAVRVSRAGFPVRIPHSDFVKRFAILIPPTYGVDDKTAAGGMCEALRVPKEHYRVGKTKVFMRKEINDKLEEERSRLLVKQALTLQRVTRGHLASEGGVRVPEGHPTLPGAAVVLGHLKKRILALQQQEREKKEREAAAKRGEAPPPPTQLGASPELPGTHQRSTAIASHSESRDLALGNLAAEQLHMGPGGGVPGLQASNPGVDPRAMEELEVQLGSVRELYYNERASQMALSNLVREIHALKDPEDIQKKIRSLEDKIATTKQEIGAADMIGNNKWEDEGLGRRTDSLTAACRLLEEKLALMRAARQAERGPSRADYAQVRAEVEQELQGEMGGRFRGAADLENQLKTALSEVQRRDVEIVDLNNRLTQMRQQRDHEMAMGMGGGHATAELVERLRARDMEVENLEGIKQKMMADRAVLESIIRNERKQREEEFNDMDANVRARDERIKELSDRLAEQHKRSAELDQSLSVEMQRRLAAKDAELAARNAKIDDLSRRLAAADAGLRPLNGAGGSDGSDGGMSRVVMDLQTRNAGLAREKAELEQRVAALSRNQLGGLEDQMTEVERLEGTARLLGSIAELSEPASVRDAATKLLHQKILECTEQQRKMTGSSDQGRLHLLASQRHLLEASRSVIMRLTVSGDGAPMYSPPSHLASGIGDAYNIYGRSSARPEDTVLMEGRGRRAAAAQRREDGAR
eukprot:CAMPEP_0177748744 /NCGR_PEP_ID=MMETSP0484_2-20121128/32102_1 /TAXON_ID=354590 /ORGANISM="Rhodomonas lens, Strain RHODO" /LENGTH=1368 /DNA_ID=CAMNT_0019263653 /DNA_START=40 /DNA_END=4145 /DNA_ORIENTATION=-